MAFFYKENPLNMESNFEENCLKQRLQNYTDAHMYRIDKVFLLNFFIKNYTNNENAPTIRTYFLEYTRQTNADIVAERILNENTPNSLFFVQKTSISGRTIRYMVEYINNSGRGRITELTNVSLALQHNNTDPIRVYKIEKDNNIKQYAVIGNKHMTQEVQYVCLGLTPNWFPELLENIDETKLNAFKNLCRSIGRMESVEYEQNLHTCIGLCTTPPEPELDYTAINTLLNNSVQDRIYALQRSQQNAQESITLALQQYEQANNELQRINWELSKLTVESTTDDTNATEIAKNFKSIVDYKYERNTHYITIRSKMLLESDAIVKKIVAPDNYSAHDHYSIRSEAARRLLEDLWINKTLQLDFCTTFVKRKGTAVPDNTTPTRPRLAQHTIPNPHLIHYNCYGDNRRQIVDAHNNNNLEYYLGSLTASNSNLNTGDATVLRKFCRDVLETYRDIEILYDVATKKYVSPSERMRTYEAV